MARYRLAYDAEDDLKRIYEYGTKTFGQIQADIYLEQLLDCFDTIAESPFSFVAVDNIENPKNQNIITIANKT